jgi:hypothetical protein
VIFTSPVEYLLRRPTLFPSSSQSQLANGSNGSPCPFGIAVFDLKNSSHAKSARTAFSVTWSSRIIFKLGIPEPHCLDSLIIFLAFGTTCSAKIRTWASSSPSEEGQKMKVSNPKSL